MNRSTTLVILVGLLSLTVTPPPSLAQDTPTYDGRVDLCARKMRKLVEALQAYRRLHNGSYPTRTASLTKLGLVSDEDLICPNLLESKPLSTTADGVWRSSGEQYDVGFAYQYELSDKSIDKEWLPLRTVATWREVKTRMISRQGWEEIPIIRCERHSRADEWLNCSLSGHIYGSKLNWEELFVRTVPMTYRSPFLVLARNAPPFATEETHPTDIPGAICLASVSNSLPMDPWWWGIPGGPDGEPAATLKPLLDACPDGVLRNRDGDFDVRYLVQVQGGTVPKNRWREGYISRSFPNSIEIPLERHVSVAVVLTATVWDGEQGDAVGKFVWHCADGTKEEHTLVYGQDTGRFQGATKAGNAAPAWQFGDQKHSLQLFATRWRNDHSERQMTHVEFIADVNSKAAPFIAGIYIQP